MPVEELREPEPKAIGSQVEEEPEDYFAK